MSTAQEKQKAKEAKELYDLKERAVKYYGENGVPQKMEEIMNDMFFDNPDDVYGHLANYFNSFAKTPVISKVKAYQGLDGKGSSTILTEIYCMVKNFDKLSDTSVVANDSIPVDHLKPEEKEAAETERQKNITAAIELINSQVNDELCCLDPTNQQQLDDTIKGILDKLKEEEDAKFAKDSEDASADDAQHTDRQTPQPTDSTSKVKPKSAKGKKGGKEVVIIPDEPREALHSACSAVSAVSRSVCKAAACIKEIPIYRHITGLRFGEELPQIHIPLPMVTIISSGKMYPGKLNCVKEFMVIPKPDMPMEQAVKHIMGIYQHCAKTLSAKTGAISKAVTELGSLIGQFDRVEQGLDLLQDAISQEGLTAGEHFHIALNVAGHEIFDYEKGKYEVTTGMMKGSEDLADYWGDILGRYSSIIALIDPMRRVEKEAWMKLCERVSERCYIVGDVAVHRPGLLKDEEVQDDFRTSGVVLRVEQANSVTDLISAAKKIEDTDNQLIIGTGTGESTDDFATDLAVGCGAKFLKLGAPNRGERVAKLNRLLQIEHLLSEEGKLAIRDAHIFPTVKPQTPTPQPEEGTEPVPAVEGPVEATKDEKKE